MKLRACVAAVALLLSASPAFADPISVDDIVALTEAQVGDDAIVAKIHSSGAHFDLSTQQMIELRKRGVSPAVLAAMVGSKVDAQSVMSPDSPDPMLPHPLGVYFLGQDTSGPRMLKIEPTAASQTKTGGAFGFAMTGGLAPMSLKIVIPGPNAKLRANSNGAFYFFVGEGSAATPVGNSFLGSSFLVTSPNDFALVRFEKKKDKREAKVGKVNLGGAQTGVMDKDRLPFTYDAVRPGVYKIHVSAELKPGEYGFLYLIPGTGTSGAAGARIFDFGVD
ncbi:MAG: hypothetical protein WBL74_14115 [Novosphingobium sp.]|uniref:hypothetical protein n=1 Tax=Novosphingobium sp. TaxID=1874826 RepID=UPI003C7EA338